MMEEVSVKKILVIRKKITKRPVPTQLLYNSHSYYIIYIKEVEIAGQLLLFGSMPL